MRISDWSSDVCSSDLFSATRTAGAEAATIGQVDVLVERGGEDRGAFLDLKATATGAQRHNKTHPILSIYRCLIAQDGFIRTAMGRVQYSETAAISPSPSARVSASHQLPGVVSRSSTLSV